MNKRYNTPGEVIEANMTGAVAKAGLPLGRMILLGILAGAFIALGAATSNTAVHAVSNVGLARTIAGCIFPVGLMMIVFVGGELFTGNCLIFMAVLDKRVRIKSFLRNLAVVYFSNLLGALVIAVLVTFSGNLDYSGGLLGAYTIKVMMGKLSLSPVQAVTSGILCNILVCAAILMAAAAKDIAGKVWAIFFPILAFVIGGFEHCVANMFYIPAGLMAAQNPAYTELAESTYGISAEAVGSVNILSLLGSFVPVTIGNILGGALCVGTLCYIIYRKKA